MDWVDRPQNYKDLYGILQLLQGSHLDNFPLKTLKLGWVAFHSLTLHLKCLDFQSNQYKKLAPVFPRFCNGLWSRNLTKKGKAKTGRTDSQCDFSGFVALSKASNYGFALTSMSFRDFNLFCKMWSGSLTITLMTFSPFGTVKEMKWNVLLNRLTRSTQQ